MIRVTSVHSCGQNSCSYYQRKQSGQQRNSQSNFSSFQKVLKKEIAKKQGGDRHEARV